MNQDQIIWATMTGVASLVTIPAIVALFRGWVPRRQDPSIDSRWSGVALGVALVGLWVGTVPLMVEASDRTQVRWMNIAFCIGAVGLAVQLAPSVRAMFGRNGRTGNRA